jgi:hypothetical protein
MLKRNVKPTIRLKKKGGGGKKKKKKMSFSPRNHIPKQTSQYYQQGKNIKQYH